MISLTADVTSITPSTDLLGKVVGDLQSGIAISNAVGGIAGTLEYVTGYTGFSNTSAKQSGNFLAVHFAAAEDNVVLSVELEGGTSPDAPVETGVGTGIYVFRITDETVQKIKVTGTITGTGSVTKTYSLADLTLDES